MMPPMPIPTPSGMPSPPGMPSPAGMPPPDLGGMALTAPTAPAGKLPLPGNLAGIMARGKSAVDNLMPPAPTRGVPKAEQQRKFAAMTKDTAWATEMAATATDPAAKYWLQIIGQHGWEGTRAYLNAMGGI